MLRGSVTASLIGYVVLMHVKELGQLLIGISSLLEKISRGLQKILFGGKVYERPETCGKKYLLD